VAQGHADQVLDRLQAEPARHPALAGPEADRRRGRQAGPSRGPRHGADRPPPRHRRGGRQL
ncbi:MAG: LSU ribosomal protein L30p (L7e), partial [uncultured Nocardioidaceae bacterium]